MPRKKVIESPQFALKLTPLQREVLNRVSSLNHTVRAKLKSVPKGTQDVLFTEEDLEQLCDQLTDLIEVARAPNKAPAVAIQKKIDHLLEGLGTYKKPADGAERVLQFKILLRATKPIVWRRIQIEDCLLADFHDYIQAAMGWTNDHLHEFEIGGRRYGIQLEATLPFSFGMGDPVIDETMFRLTQLLPVSGVRARWIYTYDFGADWQHTVLFEGFRIRKEGQKYPVCVGGQRACPPDGIDPHGYASLLYALKKSKQTAGHDEDDGDDEDDACYLDDYDFEGVLDDFDPDKFDAERMTARMRSVMDDAGAEPDASR